MEVVLVDEMDRELGAMEKLEAHERGVLHRAFSVFIFNASGQMLLQQRALDKYHSAGLWTNACCSHPYPGEAVEVAALRRLQEEMGFTTKLQKVFAFVYKAEFDNGLTEHEFDHVFVGDFSGIINPDPKEVNEYCYLPIEEIESSLQNHPTRYTAWFHLAFPRVKEWRQNSAVCIG